MQLRLELISKCQRRSNCPPPRWLGDQAGSGRPGHPMGALHPSTLHIPAIPCAQRHTGTLRILAIPCAQQLSCASHATWVPHTP